ncbi:DUF3592 domain-containing protein [Kiritimatiella glycovorans]|uniref:DUF3592 domain-containing protein n=1 Tax=Kiritimatiella glycovorans TaxID=1307763 RepID=A0A0G3ELA3_9BACT|nr:DUF3592 domain-containing protein [Kiritimatiella glycovorans]AKJ64909.1 hypothetical protein L21SP4_01667 [Kiritimatiella glycovorans]
MRTSSSRKMSPGKKFFFSRIFPLVFVVIGAGTAFLGIRGLIRAKASVDWPSTQGKVVESSVERRRSSGRKGGSSTTYHAEIMYEFTVEDTLFNGDRVAYGDYSSSSPSRARRIVNRYPKGKSVTVHYMPGNPEECLLEPGVKGQSWFLPGFGILFFTAGSLMAAFLPGTINKQELAEQSPEPDN